MLKKISIHYKPRHRITKKWNTKENLKRNETRWIAEMIFFVIQFFPFLAFQGKGIKSWSYLEGTGNWVDNGVLSHENSNSKLSTYLDNGQFYNHIISPTIRKTKLLYIRRNSKHYRLILPIRTSVNVS